MREAGCIYVDMNLVQQGADGSQQAQQGTSGAGSSPSSPSFLPPSLPHSLPASTCCAGKALRLAKKHKITTHRSPAQHNNNNTAGHGGNQKRPMQRGAAGTSAWPAGIVWGAPVFLSGGDDGGEGVVAVRWQAKNRRPAATGPLGRKRNGPA